MSYLIQPSDAEAIRRDMIAYHKRLARPQTILVQTKRDWAVENARQHVHLNMVDFWENVVFGERAP